MVIVFERHFYVTVIKNSWATRNPALYIHAKIKAHTQLINSFVFSSSNYKMIPFVSIPKISSLFGSIVQAGLWVKTPGQDLYAT